MAFSPLNALAVTPTDTARENKIYLYFFIGWYSEGKTYSAGEAVEITRDRSFAAVWDENQYFIEYYSNFTPRYEQDDAGVWDEKTEIASCGFYDEVTIPDSLFEHPDETARFIGWGLERTGKPVYKPGDVVQGLSDEWYGVVRLYARWNFPEEIITPPPEVVMSAALTPGTVKYYAYDLAGNRTDFWLEQDGQPVQTVHYAYDALNRLSTVTEGGAVQASYTYTTTGARASLTYANGTAETYTYNLANWVTGVTNTSGDSVVSSYAYTYYASGNQRSKTDHEGTVTTYTYDGLGRLTQESEAGGLTVDYAYDGRGNRSQMTVTGTDRYTVQYTYDANNRLTQEEKTRGLQTGLTTYTYDPNGNLTQRMELGCDGSPSAASFTYDVFGQQATATYNGATTAYTYNAQGIRVAKTTAESRTDFLLDGGNVAAEQTDGEITTYLRGVNLIARSERRHDGILPLQRPWGCGAADGRGRRSHQDLCLRRLRRGERPGFRRSEPLPLLRGVLRQRNRHLLPPCAVLQPGDGTVYAGGQNKARR